MTGLIILIAVIIIAYVIYADRKRRIHDYKLPANTQRLLTENVPFYNNLDSKNKTAFEARIKDFLAHTTIRGVDVEVEDMDRILIASGAIMLIFSFPDWKYNNLSEVLLYKGVFNRDYSTDGPERNVLGMVGDGAMQREMILSRPSLRSSFQNPSDGSNTVIHEFAHLIDKADGSVDGVPEYLLSQPQLLPWVNLVHDTINEMKKKGRSDINYYGAANDAEFFAVVSEYFFERPERLKENHPELYALLDEMFHPHKV
ncbi:MAG: zinc-dependent peptidase [Chitinophagales bacterium]